MVEINAKYDGANKCTLHHPDGAVIRTDAPKDIGGDASAFSPTDLVAAALASCILTTIAMYSERHNVDITGASARVIKDMNASPRRIGTLSVSILLPDTVPEDFRTKLEQVGHACPVTKSLHADINIDLNYEYKMID